MAGMLGWGQLLHLWWYRPPYRFAVLRLQASRGDQTGRKYSFTAVKARRP